MKAVILILGISLSSAALWAATVDEEVKDLAQSYNQVEAQLDRSIQYLQKTEAGGVTTVQQAWFNGAGNLLKVAVERIGGPGGGRELTEYVWSVHFATPLGPNVFMLVRQERPLRDGDIQVDEVRRFFDLNYTGQGNAVRELRKGAVFKAGKSTDTRPFPNVVTPHGKPLISFDEACKETGAPSAIAAALKKAGSPVADPFSKVKGDSERFRLIDDTASPDGRYAMAVGLARKTIEWKDYLTADQQAYEVESEEDVCNYVVDLAQQRILGKTGGNHACTLVHYGRRDLDVQWSPDSGTFAWQQSSGQWGDYSLFAGRIAPGPKLAGVAELLKEVDAKTYAFAKKRKASAALSFGVEKVGNDGVVELQVNLVVPEGKAREGEPLASFVEKLTVHETAGGVKVEPPQIQSVPVRKER